VSGLSNNVPLLPVAVSFGLSEYEADIVGVTLLRDNVDMADPGLGLGLGLGGPSDSVYSDSIRYSTTSGITC
jgi:hypothetical protein